MNVAAPESTDSDTVTAGGAATVRAPHSPSGVHERESSKATTFECLFCRRPFDMLPFYGSCGGCYAGSAEVRAIVDDVHPQTVHG